MKSSSTRVVSIVALLSTWVDFALAAPTCSRVATQWSVVFSEECTRWYQQQSRGHEGREMSTPPKGCTQVRCFEA